MKNVKFSYLYFFTIDQYCVWCLTHGRLSKQNMLNKCSKNRKCELQFILCYVGIVCQGPRYHKIIPMTAVFTVPDSFLPRPTLWRASGSTIRKIGGSLICPTNCWNWINTMKLKWMPVPKKDNTQNFDDTNLTLFLQGLLDPLISYDLVHFVSICF